ncbi:MAG: TraX family protein, partial [Candidatus Weimeria sp.]
IEEWASSDYGAAGVVTIIIMYLMYKNRLFGFAIAVIWLGFTCGSTELIAAVDLVPLYFYHGRQGRKMKYFFYVFYPAHLLILSLIAKAAGLWAYQM